MTDLPIQNKYSIVPTVSRPGLLFAVIGVIGLVMPFVQFKANRIVPGEGVQLGEALGTAGWVLTVVLALVLIAGIFAQIPLRLRLGIGSVGIIIILLGLGITAQMLTPEGNVIARVTPSAGFWLLLLVFVLMVTDALSRLELSLLYRWLMLATAVIAVWLLLSSGWLDYVSVMREYSARQNQFVRATLGHLMLVFGSLGAALIVGLPVGVVLYQVPRLRRPILGILNILQTIPSLALFGIMIPIFGWIAENVQGAASLGVAGIGVFPALVALFLYSLLPVVSNTVVGLSGVSPAARDAALGLGMTDAQVMRSVLIPLALPVILAAVRIVLVQNTGLAVIAGLIGGGGFGTFVFQGLNQTAMDLVLLGALPTIGLALLAGVGLDMLVEALDYRKNKRAGI